MSTRRLVLAGLATGIAATAPTRVAASTEVEAAGYGGTTAGGWVCGPVGRANYAGVGARVRVSEHGPSHIGEGFLGELAGSVERESMTIVSCEKALVCPKGTRENPMYAGHLRAGYAWETLGVEAGATVYQAYDKPADPAPTTAVVPDAEISYGSPDIVRGVLGLGSPTVTTLRRPGAYLGVDVPAGRCEIEARAGAFRAGPALQKSFTADAFSARGDVAVYVPLSAPLSLRLGGSVSGNPDGVGAEGSAGIRGSL